MSLWGLFKIAEIVREDRGIRTYPCWVCGKKYNRHWEEQGVHPQLCKKHEHLSDQPDTWHKITKKTDFIDPDYEDVTPEQKAFERKAWSEILGYTIEDCKLEGCNEDEFDTFNGYCSTAHWREGTDGRFD